MKLLRHFLTMVACFAICVGNIGVADDWPMYGRDATHNAVSPERNPPTDWDVGLNGAKPRNILWTAPLGSLSFGDPVVANDRIWIGTNSVRSPGYDAANDASILAGFNVHDGSSLFNYVSPRLPQSRIHDWPTASLACSPLIEGDLMWFTTNRGETVCLDLLPLKQGEPQPRKVWKVDMMAEFSVYPIGSPMAFLHTCSIASFQDRIYVNTGNGFDYLQQKVPAPQAPSLICFDKHTGQLMWQDNSPGSNIFEGQWSSPLVVEVAGRPQLVMAQGDGWLRSFDPINGNLIWKFDVNPKTAKWQYSHGTRHQCLATPVFYQQHIYIATGQNGADGEGPGRLVCIDPSKFGDISSELAFDRIGEPLPDSRIQIADLSLGHRVEPNPNSGLVWECVSEDVNDDGEIQFEEEFHLTYGNVVIKDDLLIVADFSGVIHCMDAQSGKRHWDYDAFACIFSSPLIVGDVAYVADEDGDIAIFRLAADQGQPIVELSIGSGCFTSPIFSNGVLYLATRDTLYAIADENVASKRENENSSMGFWPQWRGPNRDNISTETGILQSWPESGPPLAWRVKGLGQGISPVSVAGGRAFTLSQYDSTEYVRALDERSGKDLWVTELGAAPPQNPNMRWLTQRPPTVDDERLYAMSLLGELLCIRCADGQVLWRRSYPTEFGGTSGLFGFSDCPLIYQDKLLCTPGGPTASIVALDKLSGKTIWKCQVPDAGGTAYSNGVIALLADKLQLVAFLEKSLVGVDVENGKLLWRSDRISQLFSHPHTPLLRGNVITCICGSPAKSEPTIYQIEIQRRDGLFLQREIFSGTPVLNFSRYTDDTIQLADQIYETDNGIFNCFDLKSKSPLWRNRLGSRATLTFAGNRFYFHGSDGQISLVEAGLEEPVIKSKFMLPDHQTSSATTTPVVAGGHLFIREDDLLFCYDIREAQADGDLRPSRDIALEIPIARTASSDRDRTLRSVFVPTPQDIVDKMLELSHVQSQDLVYDLGSGDGRVVITAAKQYGCQAIGYELDPQLVVLSRSKAAQEEVANLVTIEQADLFTANLANAGVIALYLLPNQLEKLLPQLEQLPPGARIVSHYFELPGFVADEALTIRSQEDGDEHKLLLYTLPMTKTASVSPATK